MDLLSLTACGWKGLGAFAGDGGLAINFETLPEGLIAIIGENGAGKTTALELPFAALYGQFPSRPGQSLVESATDRETILETRIAVAGRGTYRARIHVDAIARATEGLLELTREDGRVEILNDGKISTFRQAVARAFPPPAVLLASAFAAQNRAGAFATLPTRGRRDLFAALLGLEQYETWATTARAAGQLIDRRLAEHRGRWLALRADSGPAALDEADRIGNALQAERLEATSRRQELEATITEQEDVVEQHRAAADAARDAQARFEDHCRQAAELTRALEEFRAGRVRLTAETATASTEIAERGSQRLAAARARRAAVRTPEAIDVDHERALAELSHRSAEEERDRRAGLALLEALLAEAAAIRAAAAELETIEQAHAVATADLATLTDRARAGERARAAARATVRSQGAPRERLAAARLSASLIDRVPCHGADPYAGCELLAAARAAAESLPTLEAAVTRLETALAEEARLEAQATIDEQAQRALAETLLGQRAAIGAGARTKARLYELEMAGDRRAWLERDLARIADARIAEGSRIITATADKHRARDAAEQDADRLIAEAQEASAAEGAALARRHAASAAAYDLEISGLETRIARLEEALAEAAAQRAQLATATHEWAQAAEALAATRAALGDAIADLARLEQEGRDFARRRAALQQRLERMRQLDATIAALETDRSEWATLAALFGREGLPVLEIDAAGPGVSDEANDLLRACFGGRFTVELITQEPTVDGKSQKEIFELQVYDSDRDGGAPKDLALLSGGEQVIVDEAIKSAIALYRNRQNVQPIRTCWRDETIGALDPENARRYVAMLQRLRVRGGFRRILFISHNLEAAQLADAQLVLADGALRVQLPPFTQEAA